MIESHNEVSYVPAHVETDGEAVSPDQMQVVISKYLGEDFPVTISSDRPATHHSMDDLMQLSMEPGLQGKIIDNSVVRQMKSKRNRNSRLIEMAAPIQQQAQQNSGVVLNVYGFNKKLLNGRNVPRYEKREISDIFTLCQRINAATANKTVKVRCEIIAPTSGTPLTQ